MPAKAIAAARSPITPTIGSPMPLDSGPASTAWLKAKPMPKAPSVRPIVEEEKANTSTVK